MKTYLATLLLATSLLACKDCEQLQALPSYQLPSYQLPYNLGKADAVIKLPKELVEISGLTITPPPGHLLCLNDEEGIVYEVDQGDGSILRTIQHSKKDDYEGIALVGDSIIAIESNGNMKVVSYDTGQKIAEWKTALSVDNDIEGLTYDPSLGRLLIAAKGDSQLGRNSKGSKSIFAFDLVTQELVEIPAYTIGIDAVPPTLLPHAMDTDMISTAVFGQRLREIAPSGIAIHPITGNIYVLSARGAVLVVLSPAGTALSYALLRHADHRQAEGIAFSADGDLYIADEGGLNKGRITIYRMQGKGHLGH